MARNFIKRTDLPTNFDIKKYDVCSTWDLGLWASNLWRRVILKNQVMDSLRFYNGLKCDDMTLRITVDCFDDPEVAWSIDDEHDVGVELSDGFPVHANRVRDVMALDLFDLTENLKEPAIERYAELYRISSRRRGEDIIWEDDESAIDAHDTLRETPEWKMFDAAVESDAELANPPFALAEIDLSASDDELVNDFRSWLTTARKNRGFETDAEVFGLAELRKLAEFRVLAYLDLKIWLLAKGLSATDQLIGETLFPELDPEGKNKAEQVRRTVFGYAKRFTSPNNLRAMQSQYLKTAKKSA